MEAGPLLRIRRSCKQQTQYLVVPQPGSHVHGVDVVVAWWTKTRGALPTLEKVSTGVQRGLAENGGVQGTCAQHVGEALAIFTLMEPNRKADPSEKTGKKEIPPTTTTTTTKCWQVAEDGKTGRGPGETGQRQKRKEKPEGSCKLHFHPWKRTVSPRSKKRPREHDVHLNIYVYIYIYADIPSGDYVRHR